MSKLPDISNWNIENVVDLSNMFDGCKSLKVLPDISIWNTFNVKDMSYMFHNCWYLTSLPNISNWMEETYYKYKVKTTSHMFHNCFSLLSFPKLNWDISNVHDMSFMFHNFPLYLISFQWNISNNQNTFHMFTNFDNYSSGDVKITAIFYLPNCNKSSVIVYNDKLVTDLIDKLFWNNKIMHYKENELTFMYNTQKLDKNLTLLEYRIGNLALIQVFKVHNLPGG